MYPNAVFGEHLLPAERKDKEVRRVAMICDKGQAFSRPHRHGDTRRLVIRFDGQNPYKTPPNYPPGN